MRKVSYIATLMAATTLSVVALAQLQTPIDELNSNPEYVALQQADAELGMKSDSLTMLMTYERTQFRALTDSLATMGLQPSPEQYNAFSDRILQLENENFEIRILRGDVTGRINAMTQEWVLAQMNATLAGEAESADVEVVELPEYRNLVENHCLKDILAEADYTELLDAHSEDVAMDDLITKFSIVYKGMSDTAERYAHVDNEAEAEKLFVKFAELKADADELAAEIERRWNHILDTKYYAYGYVLESNNKYDLLDSASMEFTDMRRECSTEAGNYAADAVMHYALGRPTLRNFEYDFARAMELEEAADSIATLRAEMKDIEYRYEPLSLERRLFIDYQPIVIGRTNFYKESNPIPRLKVYERGTIYRILLGEFRNKQPMTLFKGVQPLYITRNEDGYYLYYAGGYATRREADDAVLFLKDKDFKDPQICRWHNGKMENLTAAESGDGEMGDIAVMGKRYMIKIATDALSDDVRDLISNEAARKSITKSADGFIVGTFDSLGEVERLEALLVQKTSAAIEIIEIELNE